MHRIRVVACVVVIFVNGFAIAEAQWLNQPAVGIPRRPDGKAELNGPTPTMANGRPDLSGLWQVDVAPAYVVNIAADLAPSAITDTATRLSNQRMSDLGKDDPSTIGCLPMGPRRMARPGFAKVMQSPTLIAILYEDLSYRQVHLDGRSLPENPSPSFMGYSIGHWDGDTLVVESTGFNDRTWLDFGGHPHTDRLKTVERFRRASFGRMDVLISMTDPELYLQPITFATAMNLSPDTELLEYVCGENEAIRPRLSGRSEEQKGVVVPSAILATYVGTYEVVGKPASFGITSITVSLSSGQLFVDLNGKGHLLMVPLSSTRFSPRLLGTYEFMSDSSGTVTHLFAYEAEGRHQFDRRR